MTNPAPLSLSFIDRHYALPAPECLVCVPGNLGYRTSIHGANFQDISGNGADMLPDANHTTAFAVPGYMQSVNTNPGGIVLPVEKFPWNPRRESLIFAFVIHTAPQSIDWNLLGVSGSGTSGFTGFYLKLLATTGTFQIVPKFSGTTTQIQTTSSASFAEATPRDIHCVIAFDAPTGSWFIYKDGGLSDARPGEMIAANSAQYPDANVAHIVRLGGMSDTEYSNQCLWRGLQIYKMTGNLPNSMGRIVRALAANPDVPLSAAYFTYPRLKILSAVVGQSNEAGTTGGSTNLYYTAINNGDGCPCHDSQLVYNTSRSTWWPPLAQRMGKRGVWHQLYNTAFGSTSLTDTWVGFVRSYFSGMKVTPGSYVISAVNSHIYKAVGTLGNVYTITADPQTGGSGGATWTDQGALAAPYSNGYICASGDSLFDPNGRMALALAAVQNKPGYDLTNIFISIGQGDITSGASLAQYSQAMQNAAAYFTAQGVHVTLCMTCTYAAGDATFQSVLIPGRIAALAALASNPLVHAGADLATSMGVLGNETNAQPAAMLPIAAYINNAGSFIHFNSVAQMVAAEKHDAALELIGW